MADRFLYVFLDESGNLDFSRNGTRFFQIVGVVQERPFEAYKAVCDLRYDLIETGEDVQLFHATEDHPAYSFERAQGLVQRGGTFIYKSAVFACRKSI